MDENTLYTYINEIANHLAEKKLYGAASLMIGAGFSKNAMSLKPDKSLPPNWTELANDMYDELYPLKNDEKNKIEECSGKNILSLAQKYEVIFGRKKLNDLINSSIADQFYEPSDLYDELLKLEWEDIFTTNYDTLLERALSKLSLKREYKVIYSCKDLPNSTRPRLIKLHGSVDKSNDYIITEEDYRTYPTKYAPFVNTVQQSMLETQLCLIGFSGTDPNFLNWLGWLRDNMGDNCPRIFLCGYYKNMEYADVKMLERKNIIVLNLAPLIKNGNYSNPYHDSIKKFIEILTEKTKMKEKAIFDGSNLKYRVLFDKEHLNHSDYFKELDKVTLDIEQKIQSYVCLPKKEVSSISRYCTYHLSHVLELEEESINYKIIGRLCLILKKCCYPIITIDFKKLKILLNNESCDELSKLKIGLTLLKQSRILSDLKTYDDILSVLNKQTIVDLELNNELLIEQIKRKELDYNFAEHPKLIEKIDDSENFFYMCIKANLYANIEQKELAENKLKEATEYLNKVKIEDNKYASFIGYARLVSIRLFGNRSVVALDEDWIDNPYNTRCILNKYRENILEEIYNEFNERSSNYSFNPNTVKQSYKLNFGITRKFEESYGYQLLMDHLCLGVFENLKQINIDTIDALESYSETVYYGWNKILFSKDVKLCHQFFTREKIYSTDIKELEYLFDCIYNALMVKREMFDNKSIFVLITFLSKLSIKLDNERIVKFISLLIKIDSLNLCGFQKILEQSLITIQYAFNYDIFLKCLNFIKNDCLSQNHFSSYFIDFVYNGERNKEIKKSEITDLILRKSKSSERIDRTNAISLYLIFSNYLAPTNKQKVINNLLKSKDSIGFPNNIDYPPLVWKNENFVLENNLYLDYLCNPNLTRIFHNGAYHGNGGAVEEIFIYETVMLELLINHLENFLLSIDDIKLILDYFNEYIENEKNCISQNFMNFRELVIQTVYNINIIEGILLFYIKYNNLNYDYVKESLTKFKDLTTFLDDICDFESILENKNLEEIFQLIKRKLFSGKLENVRMASILMLLYLVFEEDKIEVVNKVSDILMSLEYYDINIINVIIPQLKRIVVNKDFLFNHDQEKLIQVFKYCVEMCIDINKERKKASFDCLYNISNITKDYYEALKENDIKINESFDKLIEIYKSIELNEIRNKWIGTPNMQL